MFSLCLSRKDVSTDVQYDYLSQHVTLDLRSNTEPDLLRLSRFFFDAPRRVKHDGDKIVSLVLSAKDLFAKRTVIA